MSNKGRYHHCTCVCVCTPTTRVKDRVINALKGIPLSDFESALTPLLMAGLPKSTFHAKLPLEPLSAQNSYEEKFSGGQYV